MEGLILNSVIRYNIRNYEYLCEKVIVENFCGVISGNFFVWVCMVCVYVCED